MYSRDWLAARIVEMGARYPDLIAGSSWGTCIIGTISREAGTHGMEGYSEDAVMLACRAAALNDEGMPWGRIPVRLGLTRPKVMSNTGELVAV